MSYLVARMQKMKAENLVGIGNHNQRKTDHHSNTDIDPARSHLNVDLVDDRTQNYKTDIQDFINDKKATTRALRKDAVLVNEWIIFSDHDFFKEKKPQEVQEFFETAKDYFAENFGEDNIRYAQIHLDETTPHMHLGIVPFDPEKKLSAKRVFNRRTLLTIQEELPTFLQRKGFDIQRGEKNLERKNLTVPEYKQAKEELQTIEKELTSKKDQILSLAEPLPEKIDLTTYQAKPEVIQVKVPSGEKFFWGTEIKKQSKNLPEISLFLNRN